MKQAPFVLCCSLQNTHLHLEDDTFKPVHIDILFYIKFADFWHMTCFVPNLIPIWPRSHGLIFQMFLIFCFRCLKINAKNVHSLSIRIACTVKQWIQLVIARKECEENQVNAVSPCMRRLKP